MCCAADQDVLCRGSGCALPRIRMCCAADQDVPCRGCGRALPRIRTCLAADQDVPCRGSGRALPRIRMCLAADQDVPCRESGCAVPRIRMCLARGTLSHRTRYSTGNKILSRPQHKLVAADLKPIGKDLRVIVKNVSKDSIKIFLDIGPYVYLC